MSHLRSLSLWKAIFAKDFYFIYECQIKPRKSSFTTKKFQLIYYVENSLCILYFNMHLILVVARKAPQLEIRLGEAIMALQKIIIKGGQN